MTDTKKTRFINAKRRGFLQGAAVAGGAVASGASLASTEIVDETLNLETPESGSKGYELTEHVKRYYQRARF